MPPIIAKNNNSPQTKNAKITFIFFPPFFSKRKLKKSINNTKQTVATSLKFIQLKILPKFPKSPSVDAKNKRTINDNPTIIMSIFSIFLPLSF